MGRRRGAVVLGAMLSLGIETVQLFLPARTPSFIDILANAAGSSFGAVFYELISYRITITAGTLNRLHLETPLMGLMYLLVPLLWIDTLAINEAPYRWVLTVMIGMCGAVILSDLFRHWWKVVNLRVVGFASLAAGAWFLTGAAPAIANSPRLLVVGMIVMFLAVAFTSFPFSQKDRRFEQYTLIRLSPIFGIYLLLLTLWFPFMPFQGWYAIFGFTDSITATSLYSLYPRVEYVAAFTILGYLTSEWRGRQELSLVRDIPPLLLVTTIVALILEFLSGFQSDRGASLVRLLLAVAGGFFGGTMYHLSRAHIRFLLGR
jgi:VanZ family protein